MLGLRHFHRISFYELSGRKVPLKCNPLSTNVMVSNKIYQSFLKKEKTFFMFVEREQIVAQYGKMATTAHMFNTWCFFFLLFLKNINGCLCSTHLANLHSMCKTVRIRHVREYGSNAMISTIVHNMIIVKWTYCEFFYCCC